jgi:hypothetical protein
MTTNTDAGASPIEVGMSVATSDGAALGTVKAVQTGYFQVDVRLRPDYWLQADFAHVTGAGQVVLDFAKEELDRYKVKELPARVVDASMPLTAEAVRPRETTEPSPPHRARPTQVAERHRLEPSAVGGSPITGHSSRAGERIGHRPGQATYDRFEADQRVETEAQAEANGFRSSQR